MDFTIRKPPVDDSQAPPIENSVHLHTHLIDIIRASYCRKPERDKVVAK